MKKLIIILFLFSFWANAQTDWEHVGGGVAVSNVFFWPAYASTGDENFSFRMACYAGVGAAWAKESFDVLIVENGEFSLIEAGQSTVAAIATAAFNMQLCKWLEKRGQKRKKTIQEQLIAEDPVFSLDNEIFKK